MNEPTLPQLTPKVVLGVAAHPDDLDFYAGGAMAAFAQQGADVYYLILTDGGKGTNDRTLSPETLRDARRQEQRAAAKILGLKDVFFLDYPDGTLETTPSVKRDIVKVVRQVKPDVVVTFDPSVLFVAELGVINHPDHRAAGQATLDAVYPLARDHLSFPELLAEGHEPHNTKTLLLIDLDPFKPSFAVDISSMLDVKFQALGAHASQFSLQSMKTEMHNTATKVGESFGYTYAEPFTRIDIR